ncbi:hypothetical protein AB0K18_49280 [Nonomuraea sp. NPDC049421]|uniref:hypothetical protein n=1 Tax=Nonomuraea sp. NPDC049421 TaxID=3155275 RepID=UPI00344A9C9F
MTFEAEQRLSERMRPMRTQPYSGPLMCREILPQPTGKVLCDRQPRSKPDAQPPHLRRRDEDRLTRRENVRDD